MFNCSSSTLNNICYPLNLEAVKLQQIDRGTNIFDWKNIVMIRWHDHASLINHLRKVFFSRNIDAHERAYDNSDSKFVLLLKFSSTLLSSYSTASIQDEPISFHFFPVHTTNEENSNGLVPLNARHRITIQY